MSPADVTYSPQAQLRRLPAELRDVEFQLRPRELAAIVAWAQGRLTLAGVGAQLRLHDWPETDARDLVRVLARCWVAPESGS